MQGLNSFIDYITNKKDFAEKTTIQNFIKDINNLKLFYCNFDYTQIINFERKEKILNIPFDKIWIENPNIKLNNGFMLQGVGIVEENPERQIIYFVTEKQEENQKIFYCGNFSASNYFLGFGQEKNKEAQFFYENVCNNVFEWLLFFETKLKKENIIFTENTEKIVKKYRIKRELKKIKYKPSEIIYISSKKDFKKLNTNNKIINKPQYAYEVMGHWRKINTIGKDRQGKRIVKGFTWVIPYKKGQGELMRKIRIINND
jgi:hypothetical protein